MLETLLNHLHNWFVYRIYGDTFTVAGGSLDADFLLDGQYFRVVGSVFNDGLHQWPCNGLTDETFTGEVWALAVPHAVVDIAAEIEAWREKNPESDKVSESVPNYSYTRAAGADGTPQGWQGTFGKRLNAWRKL